MLRDYVDANSKLVSRKESVRHPGLYVLKYKHKVFYDALWTPELMEMRGLVVDADYNIVVYPFTKIFNRGEQNTDFNQDDDVIAVRKINGFMACLTLVNGVKVVSTTGSLDSDYVKLAEPYLMDMSIAPNHTFMFEIVDPTDPHIIPEEIGAYLIGIRSLMTGQMASQDGLDFASKVNSWGSHRPFWMRTKFKAVVDVVKHVQDEGFVVYRGDDALKIKSPYYLTSKFLARVRPDKFLDMISDPYKSKQRMDEEFYPLIDHLAANKEHFAGLDEQNRLEYIRGFLA